VPTMEPTAKRETVFVTAAPTFYVVAPTPQPNCDFCNAMRADFEDGGTH
jgi:hypothetical protein